MCSTIDFFFFFFFCFALFLSCFEKERADTRGCDPLLLVVGVLTIIHQQQAGFGGCIQWSPQVNRTLRLHTLSLKSVAEVNPIGSSGLTLFFLGGNGEGKKNVTVWRSS